jgi:hypothetical protein
MAREYLPKLTIALLILAVGLVLVSAQPTHVAALSNPQPVSYSYPTVWHSSYTESYYHHHWGSWYGGWGGYYPYYYSYYYYPYYYSSGYPYYSSSSYCPSNSYNYGYPYYYSYYSSYSNSCSYTLTVNTNPSNLGTVSGGGTYTQGSSASFSVTQNAIQVSANTRYVFDHWSGDYSGVGTSGTVTVNNAMTVTAVYQLQYYLNVNAQPQNAPAPQGAGWYNAGSTATLQNGSQTVGDSGSRLVFQGWMVDGQGPQSGPTLSLTVNAPHDVTALYAQQYYLNVQSDQGIPSGTGWYDAGSTAQISVSTPVSTQYGVSIIFNGWQGDSTSTSQTTSVLMDGPKSVVATWRTDSTVLYLTIAAIIVAAVLIVAAVVAFIARGRGGLPTPPRPQAPTQAPAAPQYTVAQTQPTTPVTPHKTEHQRRKTTAENTVETNPPSNEPNTT